MRKTKETKDALDKHFDAQYDLRNICEDYLAAHGRNSKALSACSKAQKRESTKLPAFSDKVAATFERLDAIEDKLFAAVKKVQDQPMNPFLVRKLQRRSAEAVRHDYEKGTRQMA